MEETSVQALTKVIALMPPRLRRRMDAVRSQTDNLVWGGGPVMDPDVLTTLAQACRDDELVRFGYTARDADPTERRVEPLRLVSLGRRWYLVAYDRDRQDWRSFRLDRISGVETTGQRFRPRELPAEDALTFVQSGIRRMPQRYAVRVRIDADPAVRGPGRGALGDGRGRSGQRRLRAGDERRLPRVAGDGARQPGGRLRGRRAAGAARPGQRHGRAVQQGGGVSLRTLLLVLAGLVLVWLVVVALFYVAARRAGDQARLRDAVRLLPDVLRLVRRLAGDSSLPRGIRWRLGLLLAYLALPIDLVPDFIPVAGYADDVLLVAWVLRSVVRAAGPEALERHWPGTPQGLDVVRRLAGVPGD